MALTNVTAFQSSDGAVDEVLYYQYFFFSLVFSIYLFYSFFNLCCCETCILYIYFFLQFADAMEEAESSWPLQVPQNR